MNKLRFYLIISVTLSRNYIPEFFYFKHNRTILYRFIFIKSEITLMNNKNNPNSQNRTRYNQQGHNKHRGRQQRFAAPERLSINKVYDSNGPMGRQRGNASTLYEKYTTLARDAHSSGDRVLSENLMQHAEHYLRIINSIQEQMQSVYTDSYRETDSIDEQPFTEPTQPSSYSETYSEPLRVVMPQTSSEPVHSSSFDYEQPTHSASFPQKEDTQYEKPQQRRKMYPYARRKPYDPNYHQTQNASAAGNTSGFTDTHSVTPPHNYHSDTHKTDSVIPLPVAPVQSSDMQTETPKPRRVVRRRIVSADTPKGQSEE